MAKRSIFTTVQTPLVPRNKFDLSHDVKMSAGMGKLTPVLFHEMVPGDYFRVQSDMLVRMMPMSSPAFGNLRAYVHYFFVPNRLIWSHWEDFITGGEDGMNENVPPYVPAGKLIEIYKSQTRDETSSTSSIQGTLYDYFGLPYPHSENWRAYTYANKTPVSILPFLAYRFIYNEYYRDQNVDPELGMESFMALNGDVSNFGDPYLFDLIFKVRRRRYLKDYFTSALPTPQRGPDVTLPYAQDIEVQRDGNFILGGTPNGMNPSVGDYIGIQTNNQYSNELGVFKSGESDPILKDLEYGGGLKVAASAATAVTINDLRRAIALQRFYEISARSGSRYIEQIFGHFHVRSSDARLQRPEYLGGGVCPINIGEVLQTGETTETSPQGNMAGRGIGFGRSNRAKFFAEEHGFLIGILSIVPEAIYYQGVDKSWSRISKDDYYWPSFANLGEQPIDKQELYAVSPEDNYGQLFGYTPRYAEYKFAKNRIAGLMQTSLSNWTFARELSGANLNSDFLEIPAVNNPFAVQDDTDKFIIQIYNKVDALRPMPYFGNPSIL